MTTCERAVPRMLDAARDTLGLDIWPVPIKLGTKRPTISGWQKLRLTIDDLPEHFSNGNGLAWLMGIQPRPLADVDIDCAEGLAIAPLIMGPKTDRIFGRKSTPGAHRLYELSEEFDRVSFEDPVTKKTKSAVHKVMLIELRGRGGQTIVPPSVHESGEQIEWERKGDFGKAKLEVLRGWVAKIAAAALLVRYWPRGHETRHALAGMLARAGWTEEATSEFVCAVMRVAQPDNREARADVRNCYARLERDDEVAGRPKLEELLGENGKQIVSTIGEWLVLRSVSHTPVPSGRIPVTEMSNAERLVAKCGIDLRYCSDRKVWCVWDGSVWGVNDIGGVMRRMQEISRGIYLEAANELHESLRKALGKWAKESESRRTQENGVATARYLGGIEIRRFSDVFDTHRLLLNVKNGTINLRTGELYPHRREDFLTKMVPIEYDPKAACPKFSRFLNDTLPTEGLVGYISRFAGYCLTGLTSEQAWFMFYGVTASGKSTLINVLRGLLGPYAVALPENYFLLTKNTSDFATANLAGVRLATCVETNEGKRLDVAKIKSLTGEDEIAAALKYENYFNFRPQAKLVLATNHRPHVPATDDSIWRRVKVVPFSVTVPEEKRVPELADRLLKDEGPGILRLAVLGCQSWLVNRLDEPRAVKSAVNEYRTDEDIVQHFLDECCVRDPSARVARKDLFAAYTHWNKANGLRQMTTNKFGRELHRLGIEGDDGNRFWNGVRIEQNFDA